MSNKLQSREIRIGSRKYPVKLTEKEYKLAQHIEDELNSKISDFHIKYENMDRQDCLSLVLISYAFDLYNQRESETGKELTEKISGIKSMLEELS